MLHPDTINQKGVYYHIHLFLYKKYSGMVEKLLKQSFRNPLLLSQYARKLQYHVPWSGGVQTDYARYYCRRMLQHDTFKQKIALLHIQPLVQDQQTCSSPRRPLFLHALSFEGTSKRCVNFLNLFFVYFRSLKMHYSIQSLNCAVCHFFQKYCTDIY